MKVYGIEITQQVEGAVIDRMKQAEFQSRDLMQVAAGLIPASACLTQNRDAVAHRVADRIIQRERRSKNIRITKYPRWEWYGKK